MSTRGTWIVAASVLALAGGCEKDSASDTVTPTQTGGALPAGTDASAALPPKPVPEPDPTTAKKSPPRTAPAGTTRVAAVPRDIALHFVSTDYLVTAAGGELITFSTSSKRPLEELAAKLSLHVRKRGRVQLIGDKDRVVVAAKARISPKGRNVDIDFAGATGETLAELLAIVAGLKRGDDLGGRFSVRVKNYPGNQLLAVLTAMCGGKLSIARGVAKFGAAKCPPNNKAGSALDDAEVAADSGNYGRPVAMPQVPFDKIEIAGIATADKSPRVLLIDGPEGDTWTTAKVHDVVGAPYDLCRGWKPTKLPRGVDRLTEQRRLETLERQLRDLEKDKKAGKQAAVQKYEQLRAGLEKAKQQLALIEKAKQDLAANPPPHPGCQGAGSVTVRWRITAINPSGIELAATPPGAIGDTLKKTLSLAVSE